MQTMNEDTNVNTSITTLVPEKRKTYANTMKEIFAPTHVNTIFLWLNPKSSKK
jgi:hypothetical protein